MGCCWRRHCCVVFALVAEKARGSDGLHLHLVVAVDVVVGMWAYIRG